MRFPLSRKLQKKHYNMAKKGNRVQVILECTEHKESGQPGTSRYITTKNKKIRQIEWRLRNLIQFLSV